MLAKLRFYWVVTAAGAIIMALEILSARILSPIFGSSVYVWGSVISVFLGALALGYVLGGHLADRRPTLEAVGQLLALAGVALAVLLYGARPMAEWVGGWAGSTRYGPLLASTFLFGPVTVLLATVSPYAVRLAARDLEQLGNVAGRLYALSSAGSLLGSLGATFVLIPWLELDTILGLLLGATALTAAVAMSGKFSEHHFAFALTALLLAFAIIGPPREKAGSERLVNRITPYQTLEIRERSGRRILTSDGQLQSAIWLDTLEPALIYPRYSIASLLFDDSPESAVVLGLGAGTFGRYVQKRLPDLEIDFIEIDPAVAEEAQEWMGFEPGPTRRLHIQDGRRYLAEAAGRKWDLIFCDTYLGLSVPFQNTTLEFFQLTRERLNDDGVLMVNFAAGLKNPFTEALYATIGEVYRHTYLFDVPQTSNSVLIGTDRPVRATREMLTDRARELDARMAFNPPFTEVASRLFEVDLDTNELLILTDAYAPVDRLIHLEGGRTDQELPTRDSSEPPAEVTTDEATEEP